MGQQIKVGGAQGTAINNVIVGNCNAMRQAIPGVPSGYNSRLSDFCRAADEATLLTIGHATTLTFDFNTIYAANDVVIELQCDASAGACDSSSLIDYRNNVFFGFTNDMANGYPSGGSGNQPTLINNDSGITPFGNAGSVYAYNATFGQRGACPDTGDGETNSVCADPGLTDESWHLYGYGNVAPASSGSPVYRTGIAIGGVTTDYSGTTRNNPPSRGACDPLTACPAVSTPIASTPTFSPGAGTYGSAQSVTISTAGGSVICYNTTGSPATDGNTGCTTGTLYTGAVTVSTSETLYAVAGGLDWLDSSIGSAAYVIGSPTAATPTFSPPAGAVASGTTIAITSSTLAATVCYTLDGSTPTGNGAGTCTHGTSISNGGSTSGITTTTTVKAIATKSGFGFGGWFGGIHDHHSAFSQHRH